MARVTVSDGYAFDMLDFDYSRLLNGIDSIQEKSKFTVFSDAGTYDELRGKGFQYNNSGDLVDGLVKSYALTIGGQRAVVIDGMKADGEDIFDAAQTFNSKDDLRVNEKALSKNDVISGADMVDYLLGYNGDDRMSGGGNGDYLEGGKGADRFIYKSITESQIPNADTIGDFASKQGDKIDLSGVGVNFNFRGEQEIFSGDNGDLVYTQMDGFTYLSGDIDGDLIIDFVVRLFGELDLKDSDLIL